MASPSDLLRFSGAVEWSPGVARWFSERPVGLGALAHDWFTQLRQAGPDVRELLHDGYPTVCVEDFPFGYVAVYKAHINDGFFRGSQLPDPSRMLEGSGKHMRHVKVKAEVQVNEAALQALVKAAYLDIKARFSGLQGSGSSNMQGQSAA
jgi:hypothetical protein